MEERTFRFGGFVLRAGEGILEHSGQRVTIPPKALDVLVALVETPGEVLDKDALMNRVWPGTFIAESGLTRNISIVRKTLDDYEPGVSYIETIPKRGYRFLGEATVPAAETAPDAPAPDPPAAAPPAAKRSPRLMLGAATAIVLSIAGVTTLERGHSRARQLDEDRNIVIARYVLGRGSRTQVQPALDRIRKAVELSPQSAAAWAAFSEVHILMARLAIGSGSVNLEKARDAAKKAVVLDPRSGSAHAAMGEVLAASMDVTGADREFGLALRLEPESASILASYAGFLTLAARFEQARELSAKAARINPSQPTIMMLGARTEYFAGRFQHATESFREVLELAPDSQLARYYLALSLAELGRTGEARDHLRQSGMHPGVLETEEAWFAVLEGNRRPARELFEARIQMVRKGGTPSLALLPAVDAGDKDTAIDLLEAMEKHPVGRLTLFTIKVNPRLAPLRGHERFQSVVRRVWGETGPVLRSASVR